MAPEARRPGECLAFETLAFETLAFETAYHTLTSGTFGTEPRDDDGPPSPRGPGGLLRRCAPGRRFGRVRIGIFSGFGVTGPSGNSKPSFSSPDSSLTSMTRTWPPDLSLPNRTSSASGFLIVS